MNSSSLAAAVTATALLLVASPAVASAAPADGADLLSVSVHRDQLSVHFRDAQQAASGAEGTDPAQVTLGPAGGLPAKVPGDPAYAFLGEPGQPVWSLSAGGSRFPALDLTGVDPRAVDGGALTLKLVSAEGPGEFAVYTVSRWGRPTVLLDSDGRTSTQLRAGRRLGGVAWTFDTAGDYRLTFAVSARADGRNLARTATYAVEVPAITAPAAPLAAGQAPAGKAKAQARKPAAAQAQSRVISDGHVDMGPQLSGDSLRIRLRDDTASPPVWRELSDVVLKVTDKAKIPIPAGAGYAFLGRAGQQIWMLPQTQQAGIVWPGWNTQHDSVVAGVNGNVTWTVKQVTGPGEFKLFLTTSFGTPDVLFDSAKTLPQKLVIPPNTHAHGNWAFTKAGRYELAVQMSARTKAGRAVTDTRTLALAVGDSTGTGSGSTKQGGGAADGGSDGGGSGGPLAKTGANVVLVATGGVLLVLLGAGIVRLTRRRAVSSPR
jgi:surface-anchored protein